MDKTGEYDNISFNISSNLADLPDKLRLLREELVLELENNNNTALSGINGVPDEILRNYIRISRAIRTFLFDNIDTHILTIERLSDQILCRRRAYERSRKGTSTALKIENVKSDKAVIEKQTVQKDPTELLKTLNGLSKEDIQKMIAGLTKK